MNKTKYKIFLLALIVPALLLFGHLYKDELILNKIVLSTVSEEHKGIKLETRSRAEHGFESFDWDSSGLNFLVEKEQSITQGFAGLYIAKKGKYKFKLDADDAAEILINGKYLIKQDKDDVSASNVSHAEIELTTGCQLIEVNLYNGLQKGRLQVLFKDPDSDTFRLIKGDELAKINLANVSIWMQVYSSLDAYGLALYRISLIIILLMWLTIYFTKIFRSSMPAGMALKDITWFKLLAWLLVAGNLGLLIVRYLSADVGYNAARSGIISLEILNGNTPIYYFGKTILGTLDGYLVAPVIGMFGTSALTLNLLPFLCTFGSNLIMYFGLKRFFSQAAALSFLAMNAFPSFLVLYWAGEARNQYPLMLLLASAIIYISFSIYWWDASRKHFFARSQVQFILGVLSGLLIWTNSLGVIVIAFCLLTLFYKSIQNKTLFKFIGYTGLGIILGISPIIYAAYNGVFPSYLLFKTHPAEHGFDIFMRLERLFISAIPVLVGLNPKTGPGIIMQPVSMVVFVFPLVVCIIAFVKKHNPFYLFPLAIAGLNILAVLIGGRGAFQLNGLGQRYLLLISYFAMPLSLAFTLQFLHKSQKAIFCSTIGLIIILHISFYDAVLFSNGCDNGGGPLLSVDKGFYSKYELGYIKRIEQLKKDNLANVYYNYHSEIIDYLSGNEICISSLYCPKTWLRELRNNSVTQVAFSKNWANSYKLLGLDYKIKNGMVVARKNNKLTHAISCALNNYRITDTKNHPIPMVADNSLNSAYQIINPKNGDGIVIDLKNKTDLVGLTIITNNYRTLSGDVTVEYLNENNQFIKILESHNANQPFYLSGPRAFTTTLYCREDIFFHPITTSKIRLTYNKDGKQFQINELYLHKKNTVDKIIDWEKNKQLLLFLAEQVKDYHVFADSWESSVINQAYLGKKIKCIWPSQYSDPYGTPRKLVDGLAPIDRTAACAFITSRQYADLIIKQLDRYRFKYTVKDHGFYKLIITEPLGKQLADFEKPATSENQIKIDLLKSSKSGNQRIKIVAVKNQGDVAKHALVTKAYFCYHNGEKKLLPFKRLEQVGFSGIGVFAVDNQTQLYKLMPVKTGSEKPVSMILETNPETQNQGNFKITIYG
jgi:hypothetical protein